MPLHRITITLDTEDPQHMIDHIHDGAPCLSVPTTVLEIDRYQWNGTTWKTMHPTT